MYKCSYLPVLFTGSPPFTGQPTDRLALDEKLKYAKNWDLVVFSFILEQGQIRALSVAYVHGIRRFYTLKQ